MWPGEFSERNSGGGERKRCGRGERCAMECSAHRLGTDLPHCDHTCRTSPIPFHCVPFHIVLFRAHRFARRRRRPCDRDAQHRHACENRMNQPRYSFGRTRLRAEARAVPATRTTAACGSGSGNGTRQRYATTACGLGVYLRATPRTRSRRRPAGSRGARRAALAAHPPTRRRARPKRLRRHHATASGGSAESEREGPA